MRISIRRAGSELASPIGPRSDDNGSLLSGMIWCSISRARYGAVESCTPCTVRTSSRSVMPASPTRIADAAAGGVLNIRKDFGRVSQLVARIQSENMRRRALRLRRDAVCRHISAN